MRKFLLFLLYAFVFFEAGNSYSQTLDTSYNETFTFSKAKDIVFGDDAFLTAKSAQLNEEEGKGVLRLTANAQNRKGYIYSTRSFPSGQGLTIKFEYFSYGGGNYGLGADGITFFLFDAEASPFNIGGYGGSLGYAPFENNVIKSPGLSLGYLGVGLDEWGNFSNPIEGRTGGILGRTQQCLTVRGSYKKNYNFIARRVTKEAQPGFVPFDIDAKDKRVIDKFTEGYRRVTINLEPKKSGDKTIGYKLTIKVLIGGKTLAEQYEQEVINTDYDEVPPDLLRYGIASSTGDLANVHEIRNLSINSYSKDPITPPVANDDPLTGEIKVYEGTAKDIDVLGNDYAETGKTLDSNSISLVLLPSHAPRPNIKSSHVISYKPVDGHLGTDFFTYNVKDNTGLVSNTAMVRINIVPLPTGSPDSYYTTTNTKINNSVSVKKNDKDSIGTKVFIFKGPKHANKSNAVSLGVNSGTLYYDPDPGFFGRDTLYYYLEYADGARSNPIEVVILVNSPPVAVADIKDDISIGEEVVFSLVANDTDAENELDPSSIQIIAPGPQNGSYTITNGAIRYKPNSGYVGPDYFDYTIKDKHGEVSKPARVSLTIHDLPKITVTKQRLSTVEVAGNSYDVKFNFVINNIGNNIIENVSLRDTLSNIFAGTTFKVVSLKPANPLVVNPNFDGVNDFELLDPSSKMNGKTNYSVELVVNVKALATSVTYKNVATGRGTHDKTKKEGSATSTSVDVKIDPPSKPVANADFPPPVYMSNPPAPLKIRVLSNDTPTGNGGKGINGKSIKIVTPLPLPSGDPVVLPDSTIQFTPAANFTGTAVFEYIIEDRFGVVSDPAKVTVEIKALPRGANDLVKTTKDVAITAINVKNNDISKSGTTAHLSSTRPYLGQGIPDLSADGTFKYSPGPGFYGIDTVAYVLRNTSDNVESLPILIIINVNNPPIGKDTTYKASLNTPITIDIASLATDLDGTINKASVVINPSTTKGILMPIDALNGIYKYTPNNGTSGTDKFSYTIKDNAIPAAVSTANEVTIIIAPDPKIGLAKAASVTRSLNGTYDVKYKFILKNYGNEALQNISLKDDLGLAFTGADFIIKQSPVVTGTLVGNPSFNGFSDVELLSPVSVLGAGSTETVDITLNVKLTNKEGVFLNFAEAKATVPSNGSIVTDRSTSGFKPDPTTAGDVSPSDPTLIELKFPPLFIPGGFSPNNDGTNDLYVIRNTNNRKINIEVFNRWGNRVYKSSDYKNDWDGKCAEGLCLGQDLPPGTYYYIVLLDGTEKYTGYITLNR